MAAAVNRDRHELSAGQMKSISTRGQLLFRSPAPRYGVKQMPALDSEAACLQIG